MTDFDAELYLRLIGERLIIEGEGHHPWESGLTVPARALLAIGSIEVEDAQRVIEDYEVALGLRNENYLQHRAAFQTWRAGASGGPPQMRPVLESQRVLPLDHEIELEDGSLYVSHVALGEDNTRIGASWEGRPSRQARRSSRLAMMHGSWGPPEFTVGDDQGSSVTASFSGGGSDVQWNGHLEVDPPLARDTAWIEIDGHRIDLVDDPPEVEVSVEDVPDASSPMAYLWHEVAGSSDFGPGRGNLDSAIDALLAAGALSPDDPELGQLRLVLPALEHSHFMFRGGGTTIPHTKLPERWRSLFSRIDVNGGEGETLTMAVGALTPEFDGIQLLVSVLRSSGEGFATEVTLVGSPGGRRSFTPDLEEQRLVWWARDDRGNWYLGQIGDWSGGDGTGEGSVMFWPNLDHDATTLELMPTTARAVCKIRIPLRWPTAGEGDER
jgi:hypothetical protein